MRKLFFLTLMLMSIISLNAQTIIENPDYSFSSTKSLDIKKVEITDDATFVTFSYEGFAGNTFGIPRGSFIQVVGSQVELLIIEPIDIPFDKQIPLPESGKLEYILKFPAIPANTKAINFGEGNDGGTWFIDNICLINDEKDLIAPKQLLGDWYDQENGSWICSFKNDKAIYENKVWEYVSFDKGRKINKLTLKNETTLKSLFFVIALEGKLAIGDKQFKKVDELPEGFIGTKVKKTIYALKPLAKFEKLKITEVAYTLPVLTNDSASYSGRFLGWKKGGQKTGQIHVNNVLTGKQETYVVPIDDNGLFSVKFPFYYPHQTWVRMPNYNGSVFIEPGENLYHLINLGKGDNQFSGISAKVNYDLQKINKLGRWDYYQMMEKILDMDSKAYKSYCFGFKEKGLKELDEKYKNGEISEKAFQIAKYDIQYSAMNNAMSFVRNFESAYRKKHNVPRSQRKLDVEIEKPDTAYYDFLMPEVIENPLAIIATSYDSFFNRIKFLDIVRGGRISYRHDEMLMQMAEEGFNFNESENKILDELKKLNKLGEESGQKDFQEKYGEVISKFYQKHNSSIRAFMDQNNNTMELPIFIDYLEKNGKEILPEELELIEVVKKQEQSEYAQKSKVFYEANMEGFKKLMEDHKDAIGKYIQKQMMKQRNDGFKNLFGIGDGFAIDVMTSQDYCRKIVEELTPVTDQEVKSIQNQLSTNFMKDFVKLSNDASKAKIELNKKKTGYVLNDVPKTEGEKLFNTIMKKYEGKVVLVDFWATWCGPCRSAIKRIAPLKDELKGKDVVFVYITNPSSPEGTYSNMIPDIKGEHYRVSQDEWNFFSEEFQISGIPHYTLVGKKGEIINPHLSHGMSNDQFKTLFLKHMEK